MAERRSRRIELTDPRALRALAHPARLALVGLLRREGPLTATRAAERIGESPSNCSFHLRQLAKWGLVEEAGGGRGRERPWRATAMYTSWPEGSRDPELAAASQLLGTVVVERLFESVFRWLEGRSEDPPEWQEAATFGDALLYLTADELEELGRAVQEFVERHADRSEDPSLRPPGARDVRAVYFLFPGREEV